MGVRIRAALSAAADKTKPGALDRIAIAGLTNGYWSYTTTPEEYDYCGYEGSFSLFGRQEGYGWLAAGDQLMQSLLTGQSAPAGYPEPPDTAFATSQSTPPRSTPDGGTAIKQPADVARFGRAVFQWKGGDQQVDVQRGKTFVTLEQKGAHNEFQPVATDDTPADTTQRSAGDVWTETFQFGECSPVGTYRFRVTGNSVESPGAAPTPYTLTSSTFEVTPLTIQSGTTVTGGTATVRPIYPDPGAGALLALPRIVRDATVKLSLSDGRTVTATDPDGDGAYTASVGTAQVTRVSVTDACGNKS
jgi:neutral ceramidase